MKYAGIFILLIFLTGLFACRQNPGRNNESMQTQKNIYSSDREFLDKYIDIIELRKGNSSVLIAPAWQGRVMTSTCEGDKGFSFGWINYELISSGDTLAHINPYGGEERLWLGPEGGQYALFFKKGDPFEYEYWQTPPVMDTESFVVVAENDTQVVFNKQFRLTNYSGTEFDFLITRTVKILGIGEISKLLEADLEGLNTVAYSSENVIENTGDKKWTKDRGLVSIWMLGMFKPSPSATVIIPFREGTADKYGPKVNDNYFGNIPEERLKIKDNIVYFKADGRKRGKIGIPPLRSKGIMGSYDPANNALTLLITDIPGDKHEYVNSAWELQDDPYSGDALNSYNDGPLEDGSIMGPFYELESSSPALSLAPREKYSHNQINIHITGDEKDLSRISEKLLGVNLEDL